MSNIKKQKYQITSDKYYKSIAPDQVNIITDYSSTVNQSISHSTLRSANPKSQPAMYRKS